MARYRPIASATAEELRELISQEFAAGTQLPNEKDLAARLGVSRNTVREALAQLVLDGIVERRWGVGTIVREPSSQVVLNLLSIKPIRDVIADAGRQGELSTATAELVEPPSDLATILRLESGGKAWQLERLFSIDGAPAILLQDWVPATLKGRPVDLEPLHELDVTVLDVLSRQTSVSVARMEGVLDAVSASADLAERFRVPHGQPLVRVHQQALEANGAVVIHTIAHYLGDRVRLSFART
ncbi:GntR family transcriptional regulator [Nocardioides sp. LMS-CY]|uniref:GntR family transcriptional regulator n=1 Tax=Nocardioides sp. (strain LMS-CY) TaxID=2840457 RepID=UPI001C001F38|nr:GntR family transcriptional regulator [Nocardioides sp. LMS-CY]QWF20799.1 GntR family transcriptional regulator [Nocardioides sp. LMS-CY]